MWNYWNHRRQEKERTRLDEAGVNADLQKSALIAALLGKDHKSIVKFTLFKFCLSRVIIVYTSLDTIEIEQKLHIFEVKRGHFCAPKRHCLY